MKKDLVIAFDADDTLWKNEEYFRGTEERIIETMALGCSIPRQALKKMVYDIIVKNLWIYGYGFRSVGLSLTELAGSLPLNNTERVVIEIMRETRKNIIRPIELIEGAKEVLAEVSRGYNTALITKGDTDEQWSKIKRSGLERYFDFIEVVPQKTFATYGSLLNRQGISPDNFAMIGNSLKSDVIPVNNIGGIGIYVPSSCSWEYESVTTQESYLEAKSLRDAIALISGESE